MADGSGFVAMIAAPAISMPSQISRTFAQSTEVPMSASPKGRSKAVKAQIKPVRETGPPSDEPPTPAEVGRQIVKRLTEPEVRAAMTTEAYRPANYRPAGYTPEELLGLVTELRDQTTRAKNGSTQRAEEMLVAHAHTLDAIFNRLATQASFNIGHHADKVDRYLRLALKAQSQSRATLETLANIKNPPIVYARQANFAAGHQQVNNGVAPAKENENRPNELLEHDDGKWLDPRAQVTTGRGDPELEAVVPIDRTQDGKR